MTRSLETIFIGLMLLWLTAAAAAQNVPHSAYVYPAGGKVGTTFQVVVGGQFLDGVYDARISGAGVQAKVIEHIKPLNPTQLLLLRDQLKELQDIKVAASGLMPPTTRPSTQPATQPTTRPKWTLDDETKLLEIRKKLATFIPRNKLTPALAETVTVEITIAPNAAPGWRELRLEMPNGLTNPLPFALGQYAEYSYKSAKSTPELRAGPRAKIVPPEPEMLTVTLPAIVNGQIMPGEVDRFRFKATKGQRVVLTVAARTLIPYISDAVPGWFQATVGVLDAKGNEVAYADDDRFNPDPVMCYEIPSDGEYTVELKDSLYRGREDFVYRITVGAIPYLTGANLLGTAVGTQANVTLKGWNLPTASLLFDAKTKTPGIYALSVTNADGLVSNCIPFAVDALPERSDQEPNDQIGAAQAVTLPAIINGTIAKPGDTDVFSCAGRAGDELVAEVLGRRLGSPLDSVLKITDVDGKVLALNDDHEDVGSGLTTHHADSYVRFKLPTDGVYYVHLADTQHKGGPGFPYRLRLSKVQPDFQLRVVPSALNVRGGASVPLTVYALRQDGFAGEITLGLKDAPAGYVLSGARIPAGQDQIKLTLKAPAAPTAEPLTLQLIGKAKCDTREIVQPALPADDMMQAFAYRHLVIAQEMLVAVSARRMAKNEVKILSPTPLVFQPGKSIVLQINVPTRTMLGDLELEMADPIEGISIQNVTSYRDSTQITLLCDASKAKPGTKGNLLINAVLHVTPGKDKPAGPQRRFPTGTLPAIPYEINP